MELDRLCSKRRGVGDGRRLVDVVNSAVFVGWKAILRSVADGLGGAGGDYYRFVTLLSLLLTFKN